jgi:hypothetical protein
MRAYAAAHDLPTPDSVSITSAAVRLAEGIVGHSMNLRDGLKHRNTRRVVGKLALIMFDCLKLSVSTGLPLDEAFLDIHKNNMTKRPARRRGGVIQKPEKGPGFEKLDLSRLLPADTQPPDHGREP